MQDKNELYPHAGFRYRDVLARGKPAHDRYDSFSIRHPAMPLTKRAKIFSPFDALKGFNEAIAAKEVSYEDRRSLSEEDARQLDQAIGILYNLTRTGSLARENHIEASITYFIPCDDPDNSAYQQQGRYETKTGIVNKIDPVVTGTIILENVTIALSDIVKIESPILDMKDII